MSNNLHEPLTQWGASRVSEIKIIRPKWSCSSTTGPLSIFMQLRSVQTTYGDRWNISSHPRDVFSIHLLRWNVCWLVHFTVKPLACCLCGRLLCTHKLSKANFKGAYLCANCVHAAAERQICFCPLLPFLSVAAEWTQWMEEVYVCCEYSVVSCPWLCGWRFCSMKCTCCVWCVCVCVCVFDRS